MKNLAAVELGRKGGAATRGISTARKTAAARANGKKGGRPPVICELCGRPASEHRRDSRGRKHCTPSARGK